MAEKKPSAPVEDRRSFLKLAGLGAVTTGAVMASGCTSYAEGATVKAPGKGYQETDHVKTYYDLTRF